MLSVVRSTPGSQQPEVSLRLVAQITMGTRQQENCARQAGIYSNQDQTEEQHYFFRGGRA